MTYLLFVIGFALLVKGADWLVAGASQIAHRFRVPAIVIGLTIVALGTSAPEFVVNILASARGETDIALGNIVGSNIVNIWLILGISAMIYPITTKKNTIWKEIPMSVLAVAVLGIMAHDIAIDGAAASVVTRTDGLILLSFFIIFLYYTFGISRVTGDVDDADVEVSGAEKMSKSVMMIFGGLVGLVLGGAWIVEGAVAIARMLGVTEAMIGLTIVAVGTSLPELATSVVAAYRKHTDIAIGNIVGSNIFNIFFILGTSAMIRPLPVSPLFTRDLVVALLASVLLFAMMFFGRKHTIYRTEGIVMVILYVAYTTVVIVQQ